MSPNVLAQKIGIGFLVHVQGLGLLQSYKCCQGIMALVSQVSTLLHGKCDMYPHEMLR